MTHKRKQHDVGVFEVLDFVACGGWKGISFWQGIFLGRGCFLGGDFLQQGIFFGEGIFFGRDFFVNRFLCNPIFCNSLVSSAFSCTKFPFPRYQPIILEPDENLLMAEEFLLKKKSAPTADGKGVRGLVRVLGDW